MCAGRFARRPLSRGDSRATSRVTTAAPKAAACRRGDEPRGAAIGPQSADADARRRTHRGPITSEQEAVKHDRCR